MPDAPKAPPRTVSQPGTQPAQTQPSQSSQTRPPPAPGAESFRVQTAARMQPIKTAAAPQGPLSARLKEGAADTALNVVGILRDLWDDFRSSDRYFKYKALILGVWLALSAMSLVVACPGGTGPSNNIGARLRTTQVLGTPVFMIINDSGETWEDVVVVVNNRWRAAVGQVSHEVPDNTLTLEPKKLLGEGGQPAPSDLKVVDLEVRTSDGRANLIVQGQLLE